MEYQGECLCRAVAFHIVADAPRAMYLCHCSRCRRETGSMHGANVFFEDAELVFDRGEAEVRRFHLDGTRKKRWFCGTCGSPVPRSEGGRVVLPAGSLTAGTVDPTAHILCDSRADWEDAAARIPRWPGYPDQDPR